MKKLLFIDRDGTIIKEPTDEQIDSFEKLEFFPNVISNLKQIATQLEYGLVMVTNQDGLGTSSFPEDTFWPAHNKMLDILKSEGITFSEILIDRSFPEDNLPTRKPGTALLTHYLKGNYDLANSFVIGDRESDILLASNLGCQSIYISEKENSTATFTSNDWNAITAYLRKQPRKASIQRKTNETNINVAINLDGNGTYKINTGLGFFNHMLEQLSRHSDVDMTVDVTGDLHIDEHHTIEDTAIAIGEAFLQALGNKKGIERYGFLLPMDDVLAQAAIDFSGRPWLVWETDFKREKVGDMPTEMFMHFFKSFSDAAKCNLNIKAEGDNEHHKIEAIFKATAKAIRMALQKTNSEGIPSTKGVL